MGRTAPFEGERKGSAAGGDFRDPIETVHSSPVGNEEDACNVQESFSSSLAEQKTNRVLAERFLVISELQEMDPDAKSPEMQKPRCLPAAEDEAQRIAPVDEEENQCGESMLSVTMERMLLVRELNIKRTS